jgi:hypothetical protein
MEIVLYATVEDETECIKVLNKIIEKVNEFVIKKEINSPEKYWKIEDQYVVDCFLELNGSFNESQLQLFLNEIATQWTTFDKEFLASVTTVGCEIKIPQVHMLIIRK